MRDRGSAWPAPVLATAMIVGVMAWAAVSKGVGVFAGPAGDLFIGPDSWARAYRALELLAHGHWFSDELLRVGPGVEQHWSRMVDALNVAMGGFLGLFAGGFKPGLEVWGVVSGPLQFVAFAGLLVWAARPVLSTAGIGGLAMLLPIQFSVAGYFMAGRIDWHPQNFIGTVLAIALVIRALAPVDGERFPARILGLGLALMLWGNPECFIAIAAGIAVIGLTWTWHGDQGIAERMEAGARWLAVGAAAVALIEQGPWQILVLSHEEVSLFHVALFAMHWAFWRVVIRPAVASACASGLHWRLLAGAAGGAAASAFVLAYNPELLQGRINPDVDRTYIKLRAMSIAESQKIFSARMVAENGLEVVRNALIPLWSVAIGLAGGLVLAVADARRRWVWLGLTLMVVFSLGGNTEIRHRHVPMASILALPAAAASLGAVMFAMQRWVAAGYTAGARHLGLGEMTCGPIVGRWVAGVLGALVMILPLVFGGGLTGKQETTPTNASDPGPSANREEVLRSNLKVVANLPKGIIGTYPDIGPEILYRTHHTVLSIPTHRDQPGFRGLHQALAQENSGQAREKLAELGVDYLLIIRGSLMTPYFGLAPEQGATVGKALMAGEGPAWAERIPLEGVGARDAAAALFRVDAS